MRFLLLTVFYLLSAACYVFAAQEVLKTSKVRVGEKAPLTESIKIVHEQGKVIILTLLPNPMQCNRCDRLLSLFEQEMPKYPDVSFIIKGGEDMLGAIDEETLLLKKLYGFVTVGEAWTFIIDKNGILKKIFMGVFTKEEIGEVLTQIMH